MRFFREFAEHRGGRRAVEPAKPLPGEQRIRVVGHTYRLIAFAAFRKRVEVYKAPPLLDGLFAEDISRKRSEFVRH